MKISDSIRRNAFKRGLARHLRANATEAERRLWAFLRAKQFGAARFRRQQPMGPYIVDFFCPAAKLIVELDGEQHGSDAGLQYDTVRSRWLQERGYCVLRFGNTEFLKNKTETVARISLAVESRLPLPEPPSAVRPSLKGRVK